MGEIGVITLPAPDVEPVERPQEILPLLGRRLSPRGAVPVAFQFLGTETIYLAYPTVSAT